jgi:hypothetical protein
MLFTHRQCPEPAELECPSNPTVAAAKRPSTLGISVLGRQATAFSMMVKDAMMRDAVVEECKRCEAPNRCHFILSDAGFSVP